MVLNRPQDNRTSNFTMMEEDHCVYIKRLNNHLIILSLYVDDILIDGNDKQLIDVTKKWLSQISK